MQAAVTAMRRRPFVLLQPDMEATLRRIAVPCPRNQPDPR